jgi:hypothetical protein
MSLKRTVDAQIPLVSEHLQNLNILQNMRLNLQEKTTALEQEWNDLSEAQRQTRKQQLEQQQQELMRNEVEVYQRNTVLFSQFRSFESEKSMELQTLSQMRFTIRGDSSKTTRRCKVVKDFESLQSKIKDLFEVRPDQKIVLYHGNDIVGSEEELLFALDDRLNQLKINEKDSSTNDDSFIAFEVVVLTKHSSNKRRRNHESPSYDSDEDYESNNEGRWTKEEIILFSEGVKEFGWSKWSRIAQTIPGRTEEQVRAFSRSRHGQEFRPQPIHTELLKDILEGFRDTAAIARNMVIQKNAEKSAHRITSKSPQRSRKSTSNSASPSSSRSASPTQSSSPQ